MGCYGCQARWSLFHNIFHRLNPTDLRCPRRRHISHDKHVGTYIRGGKVLTFGEVSAEKEA